ncbi:MAG: right-handed parallel beta-helix repeat-containing protein [Clostridia bacterium]|nr:right-handed parallel beta-helix repeat-containing protein [Clostridia bacterium]
MVYHVSKAGNDHNPGTEDRPFLTVSKAAETAQAGDRVIVHEGIYREWISPKYGGRSIHERITYEAAPGKRPVIKGSEIIKGWVPEGGGVWKAIVPNALFGEYNPFSTEIYGDWMELPETRRVHAGDVYLNGKSLYEAESLTSVFFPAERGRGNVCDWMVYARPIENQDDTLYQWFARVNDEDTVIYANFRGFDPNRETVEINVRKCCFYPKELGKNFITVRGFEICHAANTWSPPTADQPGMIGPHWSKGWIIEDNILHDAKCCAVSLGKEISTGNNECSYTHRKPGYQYQIETVFKSLQIGWSMEKIGSHTVRNNTIYDCGQNGVVGHLGCIRSVISNNHIFRIGTKREFFGWEISAIKLHAALDCVIEHNCLHDNVLGTWLDWQAQGVRVTGNVFYRNDRDLMIEVSHGPYLVDNNILASDHNIENCSQGGAYVNNLLRVYMYRADVLNRATPYHYPHSTRIAGFAPVYGGDDRFFMNIFAGGYEGDCSGFSEEFYVGTYCYDGYPSSLEEYENTIAGMGVGDLELFERTRQPYYSGGNVFFGKARPCDREKNYVKVEHDPCFAITEEPDGVYIDINLPSDCDIRNPGNRVIGTCDLGCTRIVEQAFEAPDSSDISVDRDITGKKRSECPMPGPVESLVPGKNHIKVFCF